MLGACLFHKVIRKNACLISFAIVTVVLSANAAWSHFGAIIPSSEIVSDKKERNLILEIKFIHPFYLQYMNMEKPKLFGVVHERIKEDLLSTLVKRHIKGATTWVGAYTIKFPGDYVFYEEPVPYWEESEKKFIVHYTKVVVNAFGLENGWDFSVGLKSEIIPLTRPYGLWSGNVFQAIVKVDGKPLPYADIEVEYYNEGGKIKAPKPSFATQTIKADGNGIFTYAMPTAGWWGFAALSNADFKLKHNGKDYPVEIGAIIWVRARDMK